MISIQYSRLLVYFSKSILLQTVYNITIILVSKIRVIRSQLGAIAQEGDDQVAQEEEQYKLLESGLTPISTHYLYLIASPNRGASQSQTGT